MKVDGTKDHIKLIVFFKIKCFCQKAWLGKAVLENCS